MTSDPQRPTATGAGRTADSGQGRTTSTERGRTTPAERESRGGRGSSLRSVAVGALLGLAAAAGVASWLRSKDAPGGYVTWSRREETPAPDSLVFIWRRTDLGDIAPPF